MRPRTAALSFVATLMVACGDDPIPAPTTGSVEVEVATTGGDLDLDGYVLYLDGTAAADIGTDGTATLEDIVQGQHTAELLELAPNCAVVGENPRPVTVMPDAAASISFDVACIATGVQVVVVTTGVDFPTSHDVTVDNLTVGIADSAAVPVNGSVRVGRLAAGTHAVELTVGSGNCAIASPNSVTAVIDVGENPEVSFAVECAATNGSILVSASTSGIDRPRRDYRVVIDGGERTSFRWDGSATVDGFLAGDHAVEITDVPSNCATAGGNPLTVSVATGGLTRDTAEVAFEIACSRVWDLVFSRSSPASVAAIYLARADGADTVLVAPGEEAEWSPDGTEIVFKTPTLCYYPYSYYFYDYDLVCIGGLRVATPESDALETLTSDDSDTGAAWRPDGSKIAFTRGSRLHLVNPDGTDAAPIPATGEMPASDPSWSPDGARLAFTCGVEPNTDVCVVNADGSGLVQVTDDPGRDARPAWSPDGSRLAFTTTRFGGSSEIALVAPDGSGLTRVSPGTGATHPAWMDASTLVFAASRCDIYRGCDYLGLFRMRDDGVDLIQLTSERDDAPAWRP